jgi:hypothetical protein
LLEIECGRNSRRGVRKEVPSVVGNCGLKGTRFESNERRRREKQEIYIEFFLFSLHGSQNRRPLTPTLTLVRHWGYITSTGLAHKNWQIKTEKTLFLNASTSDYHSFNPKSSASDLVQPALQSSDT